MKQLRLTLSEAAAADIVLLYRRGFSFNPCRVVSAALLPPLQRTQGRGTLCQGGDRESKSLGHPPPCFTFIAGAE